MKKIIYCFLLAGLFANSLSAQVTLGVKSFYNTAWQQYSEDLLILRQDVYIHNFGGGLTFQYAIDEHLSIGIEPGFVQRGAACLPGFNLPIGGIEATLVGSYIEAPLTLEGHLFAWQERVQFFAKAGAGYSYMIGGYRQIDFQNPEVPAERTNLDFSQEPNLNRFDFGFYGSGGFGVKAGPGYITAECRYYHGMPNVDKNQESRNRAISYGLGYRVTL